MRRFDYDGSDDREKDEMDKMFNANGDEDDDDMDGITDEELESIIRHQQHEEAINFMHIETVYTDIEQRLLTQVIKYCEKSWFWKFKSRNTRLKEINKTYRAFESVLRLARYRRQKEQ